MIFHWVFKVTFSSNDGCIGSFENSTSLMLFILFEFHESKVKKSIFCQLTLHVGTKY